MFPPPPPLWCFLTSPYLLTTSCKGKIIYNAISSDFYAIFLCFCGHTSLNFAFLHLFKISTSLYTVYFSILWRNFLIFHHSFLSECILLNQFFWPYSPEPHPPPAPSFHKPPQNSSPLFCKFLDNIFIIIQSLQHFLDTISWNFIHLDHFWSLLMRRFCW